MDKIILPDLTWAKKDKLSRQYRNNEQLELKTMTNIWNGEDQFTHYTFHSELIYISQTQHKYLLPSDEPEN